MPQYTSVADLQTRLVDAQITLTTNSVPTSAQAESILEQVEAEAHAYLQNRYQLPLTDPESVRFLRGIVVSIACERIFALAYPQAEFNPFREEARAARELLRHIMRGEAQLPTSASPIGGATGDFGDAPRRHKVGEQL